MDPLNPNRLVDQTEILFDRAAARASRVKQIWAVGGGKGGVGKSLLSSSLAISLSRQGQRVIAVDLDLGGANLHTTLGVNLPKQTLSDFLVGRVRSLDECIAPTGIPNLDLISGAHDTLSAADLANSKKMELLEEMTSLHADYLVFDLGAGTGFHTIDFYLFADIGLVTLLPEPTSIENAYRFIKSAYYRRLQYSQSLREVRHLIEEVMDPKNPMGIKSPSDLFREISRFSPEAGARLKEEIEKFKPKLVLNQVRTETDIDVGFSVKTVCKKYFGIDMDYVGYIEHDSSVWQAVRRKRPLLMEFPNSKLVSQIERIVHYLLRKYGNRKSEPFDRT